MTEDEARTWFTANFGEQKTKRVGWFLDMVREENSRQNLISPSTLDALWTRHAVDSAQLLFHVDHCTGAWLDIGTGGGFPGMIIAMLSERSVTMVEPRKKRAAFLADCVTTLGLDQARVEACKVEAIQASFAIISARAVASVEKLLQAAEHCATPDTCWILPRGQVGADELAALCRNTRKMFHVEHSLTDPRSSILIVDRQKGRA